MRFLTYLIAGLLVLLGAIGFLPHPGDAGGVGPSPSEVILGGTLIAGDLRLVGPAGRGIEAVWQQSPAHSCWDVL